MPASFASVNVPLFFGWPFFGSFCSFLGSFFSCAAALRPNVHNRTATRQGRVFDITGTAWRETAGCNMGGKHQRNYQKGIRVSRECKKCEKASKAGSAVGYQRPALKQKSRSSTTLGGNVRVKARVRPTH